MATKQTQRNAREQGKAARSKSLWAWGAGAAAAGAALGGAALLNRRRAQKAEERNPPLGRFITVDGVKLHYLERGEGAPILLLHGNGTMIEDWIVSGVMDELPTSHRVIAFDRPGFGHSERPRSRIWTPQAQAALIAKALRQLNVGPAHVVGHSFGTLVAVALALDSPQAVSRLTLLGGYYYPSVRADVLFASQPAIPVVGDVMRYTVSPLIGTALMPQMNARVFSPAPVPQAWLDCFPFEMTTRPQQIRAEAAEAAMMIPAAAALAPRYESLSLPITIIAGEGDKMVTMASQSELLHKALPQSRFVSLKGVGHMVHHSATGKVIAAIRA